MTPPRDNDPRQGWLFGGPRRGVAAGAAAASQVRLRLHGGGSVGVTVTAYAGAAPEIVPGGDPVFEDVGTLGARWSAALRRRCPGRDQAKRVAGVLRCDPETAGGWLSGKLAGGKHLARAARVWGAGILLEVFLPEVRPEEMADAEAQLLRLRADLEALGEALARVEVRR